MDGRPEMTFARVFRRLGFRRTVPEFHVEYCPFTGLRSTICCEESRVRVRISDLLKAAPTLVLEALAEILLSQVFRLRPSREARECYLAYVCGPVMRRRVDEVRRQRGSKRLLAPQGRHYDLEEVFTKLNHRFFAGRLLPPRLGWSPTRSRTILGHHDSAHQTITISRRLDSPSVPRYLIDYLVFHEMLHMRFPMGRRGARRVLHSAEFREAEKKFPKYVESRRRLKRIAAIN